MRASASGFSLQLALLVVLGRSAMADGSAIDLLDPPEGRGRFELRLVEANLAGSGYWWKSAGKSAYTSFRIDERVDQAIRSLLSDRSRFEGIEPGFELLAREHYTGSEYQVTLRDLIAAAGVVPSVESVLSLLPLVPEAGACRDALTRAEKPLDAAVEKLRPAFVRTGAREEWRLSLEPLGPEITALHHAIESDCKIGLSKVWLQGRGLRFERSVDSGRRRLSIFDTRSAGEQAEERPVAELTIWEDETIPPPPAKPSPARLADKIALFRLKIQQCHGLPWEYSEFAASDTWIPPSSSEYLGPTPLSGRYSCEDEAFATVKTWGPADAGRARGERVFASLREAARKSEPSAGPLATFGDLLDGVKMQEDACLRLDPGLMLGPRRYVWEASREQNVEPGSLEPATSGSQSSFAHVSLPKDLMRQFDAIVDAVAKQGFAKREDNSLPGLRTVGLESVEAPDRPSFGFQLSLDAQETSAGSIRVSYRFRLGTPCLVAPQTPVPAT
jgi:hypothetical protein